MSFFILVVLSLLITADESQGQRQGISTRKFPRYDFFSRKGTGTVSSKKDTSRPLGLGRSNFLSAKGAVVPRKEPEQSAVKDTNIANLVSMVSSLTSMLEEQSKVIRKLEVQTELLASLLKESTESNSKALPKITTLKPNKLVSTTPSYLDWNYSNQATWSLDYPGCGKENQSPIDLRTVDVALKDHKSPINFSSYDKLNKATCIVSNNGMTVTLSLKTATNLSTKPILSGGPFLSTKYFFTQAVFHWGVDNNQGSDHTIRGTTYPLEMQLIHQTSSRGESELAITSFLFEESEDENPFLAGFITAISNVKTAGSEAEIAELKLAAIENNNTKAEEKRKGVKDEFSMDLLIKDSISGPYFTYPGSLTYPPCTEVKQYVVFRDPIDISSTQLEQFRLLLQQDGTRIADNFRQVQTLGDRVLAFTVSSELISDIFNL